MHACMHARTDNSWMRRYQVRWDGPVEMKIHGINKALIKSWQLLVLRLVIS